MISYLSSIRFNRLSLNLSHSFAETSPEDSSGESEGNTSDEDEKPMLEPESSTRGREESQAGTTTAASKLPTELPAKKEKPKSKDSKLVQATVSNLFKKAEEKTAGTSKAKSSSKA